MLETREERWMALMQTEQVELYGTPNFYMNVVVSTFVCGIIGKGSRTVGQ